MFIFLTIGIVFLLRMSYFSPRPYSVLSPIRLVVKENGYNSFPSGHMAISITILTVILMTVKNHKPLLTGLSTIYTLFLAFILMYAGVHYPIDIISGALTGFVISVLTVFLADKYFYDYFNSN